MSALAELIAPDDVATFRRDVWQRRAHHWGGAADRFSSWWSTAALEVAVTSPAAVYPDIALARPDQGWPPSRYTSGGKRIDLAGLRAGVADGATVVAAGLQRRVPHLTERARTLAAELGVRVQINAYRSPAGAAGFAPHWDVHDVFVVQLEGAKRWRLYGTPLPLPLRSQRAKDHLDDPGRPRSEWLVTAGDALYVPRGVVHDAIATDAPSLHLTIGLVPTRVGEVAVEAVAGAMLEDVAAREAVCLPWSPADPDARPRARAALADLLRRIADDADRLDQALDATEDALWAATPAPPRPSGLCQPALSPTTRLAPVAGVVVDRHDDASGTTLTTLDREFVLPAAYRSTLDAVLAGPVTLDALDADAALPVVERLLGEGVLRVVGGDT